MDAISSTQRRHDHGHEHSDDSHREYRCDATRQQFEAAATANSALYHDMRSGTADIYHLLNLNTPKSSKFNSHACYPHLHVNGDMSPTISTITSTRSISSLKKPEKGSSEYQHQVLDPRGIDASSHKFDRDAFEAIKLPSKHTLIALLGDAYVDYDSSELALDSAFAMNDHHEAEWTSRIYEPYFLRTNPARARSGVQRKVQPSFNWSGPSSNICPPPSINFDRRASGLPLCKQVWAIENEKKCKPDHCYYVCENISAFWRSLPAFRGGIINKQRLISCPPYLVTEEKSEDSHSDAARHYLCLILGCLLYERLLLRHMEDQAQATSEISSIDLCLYGMTNCGQQVTIYKMFVPANVNAPKSPKRPVRFDLNILDVLDITIEAEGDKLKTWINFIHYWGMTIHKPAVMAEGFKAFEGMFHQKNGWEERLASTAFYYTAKSNTLSFETVDIAEKLSTAPGYSSQQSPIEVQPTNSVFRPTKSTLKPKIEPPLKKKVHPKCVSRQPLAESPVNSVLLPAESKSKSELLTTAAKKGKSKVPATRNSANTFPTLKRLKRNVQPAPTTTRSAAAAKALIDSTIRTTRSRVNASS